MSEPRKNHLAIDGGQAKEDEHVSSYKPIPETDTEFRTSKSSLAKSKEKISPDGAEEKLLPKEEEVKIVTRVDMADAKYIVEDHRNGDAKIELDANKRQFTGLSKEELMKYADDPFWVNIRWFMFVLFWAMWLCMLAGAITIIVKAPKCPLQPPRTWFEKGPLVEMGDASYLTDIEPELPKLQSFLVQGIFVDVPTYQTEPSTLESFKKFVEKAKSFGIKVIVDLIPNYVGIDHDWFKRSVENKDPKYKDYFVWRAVTEYDTTNQPKPPTSTWKSTLHEPAWTLEPTRNEFYLHHYETGQPDLNFNNEQVVQEFDSVIRSWMKAGAAGIRLNKARLLLVNSTFPEESIATGKGSTPGLFHDHYNFWQHKHTSDLPLLEVLLTRWLGVVDAASETPGSAVFTLAEQGDSKEWFLSHNVSALRPAMSAPLGFDADMEKLAAEINLRIKRSWPAMQLNSSFDADEELAVFSMLLPASPVFTLDQLRTDNDTANTEALSHIAPLREDATLQHGHYDVSAAPDSLGTPGAVLACARWKAGKSGYVAVFNPADEPRRANLTLVRSLPADLSVHHMSHAARLRANHSSTSESVDDVLVPPRSTVILAYVPRKEVEK